MVDTYSRFPLTYVGSLVTKYGNESDCDFPNIKVFVKGIQSSAKIRSSDQHIARIIAIFIVLLPPNVEGLVFHKKGRKEIKDVSKHKNNHFRIQSTYSDSNL